MFHSSNMSWPSDVEVEMEHPDGVGWMNSGEFGCFQPGSLKHKSCVAWSKKPSCSLRRHEQLSRTCLLMRPIC